jgi:hypothetical protein
LCGQTISMFILYMLEYASTFSFEAYGFTRVITYGYKKDTSDIEHTYIFKLFLRMKDNSIKCNCTFSPFCLSSSAHRVFASQLHHCPFKHVKLILMYLKVYALIRWLLVINNFILQKLELSVIRVTSRYFRCFFVLILTDIFLIR